MLKGKAKTDYQREYMRGYMRRLRAKNKDSALSGQEQGLRNALASPVVDEVVKTQCLDPIKLRPVKAQQLRPEQPKLVRPPGISDNQWAYIQYKAEQNEQEYRP